MSIKLWSGDKGSSMFVHLPDGNLGGYFGTIFAPNIPAIMAETKNNKGTTCRITIHDDWNPKDSDSVREQGTYILDTCRAQLTHKYPHKARTAVPEHEIELEIPNVTPNNVASGIKSAQNLITRIKAGTIPTGISYDQPNNYPLTVTEAIRNVWNTVCDMFSGVGKAITTAFARL